MSVSEGYAYLSDEEILKPKAERKVMENAQGYIKMVFDELRRAEAKFPGFPIDPIHAAAVLAEESGELQKACLQWTYEGGEYSQVLEEAIQTAAMAFRFLINMEKMEPRKSEQA